MLDVVEFMVVLDSVVLERVFRNLFLIKLPLKEKLRRESVLWLRAISRTPKFATFNMTKSHGEFVFFYIWKAYDFYDEAVAVATMECLSSSQTCNVFKPS